MLVIPESRTWPGVIGRVGTLLGGAGIISAVTTRARVAFPGHDALAAITVDQPLTTRAGRAGEGLRIALVRLVNFGD